MEGAYPLPAVGGNEGFETNRLKRRASTAANSKRPLLLSSKRNRKAYVKSRQTNRASTAKQTKNRNRNVNSRQAIRASTAKQIVNSRKPRASTAKPLGPSRLNTRGSVPGAYTTIGNKPFSRKRPRTTFRDESKKPTSNYSSVEPISSLDTINRYRISNNQSRRSTRSPYCDDATRLLLFTRDNSLAKRNAHANTAPEKAKSSEDLTVYEKFNLTIRPKTALGSLPLPPLDQTYGATRGWLYRRGDLATGSFTFQRFRNNSIGVSTPLKWNRYYYTADPLSQTLIELVHPKDEISRAVIMLHGARICSVGKSNGSDIYCFTLTTVTRNKKEAGKILLGCEEERTALKWMKVLRGIIHQKEFEETQQEKGILDDYDYEDHNRRNPMEIQSQKHIPIENVKVYDGTSVKDELRKYGITLVKKTKDGELNVKEEYDERIENEEINSDSPWRVITMKDRAAEMMQKVWRGMQARFLAKQHKLESESALVLQSMLRGHAARKEAKEKRKEIQCSIIIQCAWRQYQAKLELRSMANYYNCATKIQKTWHMFTAGKRVQTLRIERRIAVEEATAELLEAVAQHFKKVMKSLLEVAKVRSVIKIQNWWRMRLGRSFFILHMKNKAARRICNFFKTLRSKSLARAWRRMQWKRRHASTTICSRFWRVVKAQRVALHLRLRRDSATIIQAQWRKVSCVIAWKKKKKAAIRLVNFALYVIACKVVTAMKRIRWIRKTNSIKIQSLYRGFGARKLFYVMLKEKNAAIKIQSLIRRHLAKIAYVKLKGCTLTVQRCVRVFQACRLLKALRLERLNNAASRIQKVFREWFKWRAMLIFRQRASYQFSKPGFLCRILVRSNGRHLAGRISLVGTSGNFSVNVLDISSGQLITKIFCGWYIARVISANPTQVLTAPEIARILILESAQEHLSSLEEFLKPVFLPPCFNVISQTLVQRSLWETMYRFPNSTDNFKSSYFLLKFNEIPDSFIEERIKQSKIILEKHEDEFEDHEVSFARVLIELKTPNKFMFYKKIGRETEERKIANQLSKRVIFTGLRNCCIKIIGQYGKQLNVDSVYGFSIEKIERKFIRFVKQIEEAKALEKSIFASLEELSYLHSDLLETSSISQQTTCDLKELAEDLTRWRKAKKLIEEEKLSKGYKETDPRDLLQQAEINFLEDKILEVEKVCQQQKVLLSICELQELNIMEINTAIHKVKTEFMYLVHRSKGLRMKDVKEKAELIKRAKPLVKRMNEQYGIMLGAYALRNLDLMSRCEEKVKKLDGNIMLMSLRLPYINVIAENDLDEHLNIVLQNIKQAVYSYLNEAKVISEKDMRERKKAQISLDFIRENALKRIEQAGEDMQFRRTCFLEEIEMIKKAEAENDTEKANQMFYDAHEHVENFRSDREIVYEFIQRRDRLIEVLERGIEQVEEAIAKATLAVQESFAAKHLHHAKDRIRKVLIALELEKLEQASEHLDRVYERIEMTKILYTNGDIQLAPGFMDLLLDTVDYLMDDIDDLIEAKERIDGPDEIKSERDPVENNEEEKIDEANDILEVETTFLGRATKKMLLRRVGDERFQKLENSVLGKFGKFLSKGVDKGSKKVGRAYDNSLANKEKMKQRVRNKAKFGLEQTVEFLKDPNGKKKKEMEEAALRLQRIYRGMHSRRKVKHAAALRIQRAWRRKKGYEKYKKILYEATEKHYDASSGRYYYCWLDKVSWKPPKALRNEHITYGRRKREKEHVWTELEAAQLVQGIWRAKKSRETFIELIKASYEKVYEPTRDAYFYQNIFTKRCQWNKPFGLKDYEEVNQVFIPPNSKAAVELAFWASTE